MKLVVFSDAHGYRELVDKVLDYNPDADYVISLGDSEMEQEYFLQKDIIHVKGNYPRDPGFVYERDLMVGSLKILITHGHKYKVHRTLDKLMKHAISNEYSIALFGHTHVLYQQTIGKSTIINPGSLSNPRSSYPPSYCIITTDENTFTVVFKDAWTNETLEVTQ